MIKGFLFSKSLKQLFSIGLISCFIFLGSSFVNAGFTQQIGTVYDSNINNNYKVKFLNGGAFESSYLGLSKNILALRDNVVVWRTKNGFPYFYLESSNVPYFGIEQGFPDRYYLCDEITLGQINVPGNCTESNIWNYSGNNEYIKNDFINFFSKVKQNDYVYYNFVDFNWEVYLQLCRNSSELGNSLCFKVGKDNGYISGNVVYHVVNPLINSQNLNDDFGFAMVPTDWIGLAPGVDGYLGNYTGVLNGSNQGFLDSTLTGDYTYLNCTYGAIISYLENLGMSRNLCYGGLDNFDLYDSNITYNPIPGSGKSLGQILSNSYNTWDTPVEWFNYWNGLRGGYVDMWSSYPAVWKTWFDIYYQYGGDMFLFDTVREYCIMKDLNLNPDSVYHGTLSSSITAKACQNIQNDNIGILDSSGNIIVGVNWNGVGNISGNKVSSPVGYIQDFFNMLKLNFPDRHDLGGGFLPVYIITFMLALILFRFLSH